MRTHHHRSAHMCRRLRGTPHVLLVTALVVQGHAHEGIGIRHDETNHLAPPQPVKVGAAVSGTYRNVFVEAGYPAKAVDDKINAAVQQLFFTGRLADQRIYHEGT